MELYRFPLENVEEFDCLATDNAGNSKNSKNMICINSLATSLQKHSTLAFVILLQDSTAFGFNLCLFSPLLFLQVKKFAVHTATVNDLSFDADGEYIGSCSDDGTIVISSLFTDEKLKFEYYRPMKALALDPDYSRKSSRRYVAGGLAGQLFLNTQSWLGYSKQVFFVSKLP